MGKRYSDIVRAKELDDALTAYKNWQETRFNTSKRKTGGTVGDTRRTAVIYVKPFGNASTIANKTRRGIDSNNKFGTTDTRVFDAPTGANGAFGVFSKGQRPCRVFLFEGSGARAYEQSEITGLFYIKYAGDNYSTPIGRKADDEREAAGVADAFTYMRGLAAGKDYVRVWHKPEDLVASRS